MKPFTKLSSVIASAAGERKSIFNTVNMGAINLLLGALRCQISQGHVQMVISDRVYGLAVKLTLVCESRGEIMTE